MPIKINLDQWADGGAPDAKVATGSQKDTWQNGNLGSSQAHYAEGEFVPYRAVFSSLTENQTYITTIQWDTLKNTKHALDYIGTFNYSFPAGRNETFVDPLAGTTGLISTATVLSDIPIDPHVAAGPDGDLLTTADNIDLIAGSFTFVGGAANIKYVWAGADSAFNTVDDLRVWFDGSSWLKSIGNVGSSPADTTDFTNLFRISTDGNSTSLSIEFTYIGNGATAGSTGTLIGLWGGHIATRADWGPNMSAAAISGSPYHMRLTGFVDNDPKTSDNVGNQDRSLSSDAVTFPGQINVVKQTDPDASAVTFSFEMTRPANTLDVISGQLDVTGDGVIDGRDDGRFIDSSGDTFTVTDGSITGGSGPVNTYAVIGGKLDVNNDASITALDGATNIAGTAVASFSLHDGESATFGGLESGTYVVKELVPNLWDLTSVTRERTDINNAYTSATISNPAGDSVSIVVGEADDYTLTFFDKQLNPSFTVTKAVTAVDGSTTSLVVDEAGDAITYRVVVTNTGNVDLTSVSVTDLLEGSGFNLGSASGDGGVAGVLEVGESWTYLASYTADQEDVNSDGHGDSLLTNTVTVDTAETDPQSATTATPVDQNPALSVTKQVYALGDGNDASTATGVIDGAGDTITYRVVVTNTGNLDLTSVSVTDLLEGASFSLGSPSGDGTVTGVLDVGESWTYLATYTVTQGDLNTNAGNDGFLTNTVTVDTAQTDPQSATTATPITVTRSIDLEKDVSVDGGVNWFDADTAPGPTLISGNPIYRYTVTNTGNVDLHSVTLSDVLDGSVTIDLNGATSGTALVIGDLAPGAQSVQYYTGTFLNGAHQDIATVTAIPDTGSQVSDTDPANFFGLQPVVFTGNPQFNFPNDVSKIQPKLQGGSFTINAKSYIYWDLFTSNNDLASILTTSGHSDYSSLSVSIQRVWYDDTLKDAIYRVYVANETDSSVSLANNTDIVSYTVVASSTDKGLIDLVNADPLIGNFNNFSNIENALLKDATDNFLTNPSSATVNSDKIWLSADESGTATAETPRNFDADGGNDALYGRVFSLNGNAGDTITGGAGNDLLDGRADSDSLVGGAGNDYLFGGLGSDTLLGGDGDDTLVGSYSADRLVGGNGADVFVVRVGDFEMISDFDETEGDKIYFWIQTFDTTGASAAVNLADVNYAGGVLSYKGTPIASFGPDDVPGNGTITVGASLLGSDDVFVT
jgi:uncharacterized repeat protein (TIGR01451 family)